jgi:hypothetical protein
LVLHAGAFPFWRLYRQIRREALGLPFRGRAPGGLRGSSWAKEAAKPQKLLYTKKLAYAVWAALPCSFL